MCLGVCLSRCWDDCQCVGTVNRKPSLDEHIRGGIVGAHKHTHAHSQAARSLSLCTHRCSLSSISMRMLFDETESVKCKRSEGERREDSILSVCIRFCLLSCQVQTDNGKTEAPISTVWPLICVQHAAPNFNIMLTVLILFFTQRVDSLGQIKQCTCERRVQSVEIHQPTSPQHLPSASADTNMKGTSWQQLCSGTERSLIMNTKSASEKGYRFQTPLSLPCTSAVAFIIAFSLSFHCHLFCQGKYELWLCSGSVGGRKGDEREMVA